MLSLNMRGDSLLRKKTRKKKEKEKEKKQSELYNQPRNIPYKAWSFRDHSHLSASSHSREFSSPHKSLAIVKCSTGIAPDILHRS